MSMVLIEQLAAVELLAAFMAGISCGLIGSAVVGSRRGILLWPTSDGLLCAGARVTLKTWTRGYDTYPEDLLPGDGEAAAVPRGDDGSESHGHEASR